MPQDIHPRLGLNVPPAIGLLVFALVPAYVAYIHLKHGGLASILYWHPVVYLIAATGLLFAAVAAYLLLSPQRVGVDIRFHQDGFILDIREYFRRDREFTFNWADIETIALIQGPRGPRAFRITAKNKVRAQFGENLINVKAKDALSRFEDAAKIAGYRLEGAQDFDVFVMATKSWRIVPIA